VKTATLGAHLMHEERYELNAMTARAVNQARRAAGRVIAVGTSTIRVLESLVASGSDASRASLVAGTGKTRLFIYPPYDFKIADILLTNFHLPRSTLLMLVSAFAAPRDTGGRELVLSAYAEAIRKRYRFFSYGDAMIIL
jgi:S-adenosylmethionine:tRNA ribosyltransferase-isomerase